ncbi:MAG TPA: hypothetical protein VG917_00425 [Patescibacteria group bacterium]|nr:hypothetical protein [Patescibacteria group bacterium]
MSSKPIVRKVVEEVAEKPLKAVAEEGGKQLKAASRDFVQQLFGTTDLSDSDVVQRRMEDKVAASQNIDYIHRELGMMSGKKTETINQQNKQQSNELLKRELHREQVAEVVDNKRKGPTQQEIDRRRLEDLENEKKNINLQRKQAMMAPVEAPMGRKTGMPKRKSAPHRMQPPKTSENKAGSSRE